MRKKIRHRLLRSILWISLIILFNIFAALIVLRLPYFQTKLVQVVSRKFSENIGFKISVNRIDFRWFDRVSAKDIDVYDTHDSLMIHIEELIVNFQLKGLRNGIDKELDALNINGSEVHMIMHSGDSTFNINRFVSNINKALASNEVKPSFVVGEVELTDTDFNYDLKDRPILNEKIDFNHLSIVNIDVKGRNLFIRADTLLLDVLNLSATEKMSDLSVKNAKTDFSLTKSSMVFSQLDFPIGSSRITDSLAFEFGSFKNFSNFKDSVQIAAHLANTNVSMSDLTHFSSSFSDFKDDITISGDLKGTVSDFDFNNFSLNYGKRSSLSGSVNLVGLPNFDETFVFLKLRNSFSTLKDLGPYLPNTVREKLAAIDSISFSGSMIGYAGDFVANGYFNTNLGTIISDINLKTSDPQNPSYSGNLQLINFALGSFAKNPRLGLLDLKGRIQGKGFTLDRLDFELNGTIEKIEIMGYPYQNIVTNATMAKEFFSGSLQIDDPNLKFDGTSSVDLRNKRDSVVLNGVLSRADLQALNLVDVRSHISGNLNIKVQGLEFDSIIGAAELSNINVEYGNKSMTVEHADINSVFFDSSRLIHLETEKISLDLFGNYSPTQAFKDIKRLGGQYFAEIDNDSLVLAKLYSEYQETPTVYSLDYQANIIDPNSFLSLFIPYTYVSSDAVVEGSFLHGTTPVLTFNTRADSASFGGKIFQNSEISLVTSKTLNQKGIQASVSVTSGEQLIMNKNFQNLGFDAIWDNRVINFNTMVQHASTGDYADLAGSVIFDNNSTTISMRESDVQILGNHWSFDSANYIRISKEGIVLNQLKASSLNQQIGVDGQYSTLKADLNFTIDSLRIGAFNAFSKLKFDGVSNGQFRLIGVPGRLNFEGLVNTTDFSLNGFPLGSVVSESKWNKETEVLDLDFTVQKNNDYKIRATGILDINAPENNWKILADVEQLQITLLKPYFDSFFSNLKGAATGQLSILGPLTKPYLEGTLNITNGQGKVNYLNTVYPFEGNVSFDKTHIYFDRLNLQDTDVGNAQLYGNVTHQNFRNFVLNLEGDIQNFKVLNTTSDQNKLFYGLGKATGKVLITGPATNVVIGGQAKTERGTRIAIPMTDYYSVEQENYISFSKFSNTIEDNQVAEITTKELSGITFDYDLEITPDAYAELIFDIRAGDIIRGRGNGNINLKVDTKGDFYMFGDYVFESGGYNFTMYNIVNKEFDIEPKSTISWTGDPYEGQLNLRAKYRQLASILPLLDKSLYDVPEGNSAAPGDLSRRYPTEVTLELTGSLLSPNIEFEIDVTEYPNIVNTGSGTIAFETLVSTIQNEWVANEQEFNRQVFSLLVLRKFSPKQSFDTPGSIGSSVSEFVSNQLSYWISQVNENLEVDVNLGELSEGALNTFQLRLSYAFLEGRLRVTYDGAYDTEQTETDVANILGDWTVEYLLSKDGRFRARMYKKTDYGNATRVAGAGANSTSVVEGGFSLLYTISFEKLKDLFNKSSTVEPSPPVPLSSISNIKQQP